MPIVQPFVLVSSLILLAVQIEKPPVNVSPPKTGLAILDERRPVKLDSEWTPVGAAQYWGTYTIRGDAEKLMVRIRAEGKKAGYRLSGTRLYPPQRGPITFVDFKGTGTGLSVTLSWVVVRKLTPP